MVQLNFIPNFILLLFFFLLYFLLCSSTCPTFYFFSFHLLLLFSLLFAFSLPLPQSCFFPVPFILSSVVSYRMCSQWIAVKLISSLMSKWRKIFGRETPREKSLICLMASGHLEIKILVPTKILVISLIPTKQPFYRATKVAPTFPQGPNLFLTHCFSSLLSLASLAYFILCVNYTEITGWGFFPVLCRNWDHNGFSAPRFFAIWIYYLWE